MSRHIAKTYKNILTNPRIWCLPPYSPDNSKHNTEEQHHKRKNRNLIQERQMHSLPPTISTFTERQIKCLRINKNDKKTCFLFNGRSKRELLIRTSNLMDQKQKNCTYLNTSVTIILCIPWKVINKHNKLIGTTYHQQKENCNNEKK